MKESIKKGFSFGLTSGIITTLGLMVGLYSSTESKFVVMGGIFVIAIADALSDSMGMHISEEFRNKHSDKEVWESTFATFFSKFIFAFSFIIPILLFELKTAVIISIIWGFLLITILSFYISKGSKHSAYRVILEHLSITALVIVITYYVGILVRGFG